MRVQDLEKIRIKIASPEDILSWSRGEVTKPETINYRTQRAEKDGLFCEKIFGPEKDYECYCGKYRRIRYKGIVCDRCGVEVTKSLVRRERMGHIKLSCPVSHIWFLKGIPSRMGMVLDISMQQIERVIYFASYIITKTNDEARKNYLEQIEKEYIQKAKAIKSTLNTKKKDDKKGKQVKNKIDKKSTKIVDDKLQDLKALKDKAKDELVSLKPFKILSELEYHNFSLKYGEVFEAGTGAEILRQLFQIVDLKQEIKKIKAGLEEVSPLARRKLLARLKFFQSMESAGVRPEWMFLTMLPVLPPDLRPMVQIDGGRYASSDLNDLYRRVINRNNRLKYLLEIAAPDVIVRNEKRMLQEAVDALIDNKMRKGTMTQATTGGKRLLKSLTDMLEGKQGRFRQNLLGKRVDYSGRSVIVVGPELKLHQCGIPKKMALELFKPFVIHKILEKELAFNVRGATRLIEEETDEIWATLEEVTKDKLVLLNRAPTLHRLGIQAFQPILIEGEALRIHPFVCRAFNADFDGDQMAVHLPLSEEAQKEAREIILSTNNLLKPATGLPIVSPDKDIVLGCYWMTRMLRGKIGEGMVFGSKSEAMLAHEFGLVDLKVPIQLRINDKFIETSVGRIIFNGTLPENFAFYNEVMGAKNLERLIRGIFEEYSRDIFHETLDKIKALGFEYSTLSGITWGMNDLIVPEEKKAIIEAAEKEIAVTELHYQKGLLSKEEKRDKAIEIWNKVKSDIEKLVPKTLPSEGPVFQIVDSGARGSWNQPVQMAGMKGLVVNPAGETIELPVKHSFKEGFDVLEYFISTHGARKGTADTALRTSTAGYLTRRLVDVAHEVIVSEEDCRDGDGIEIFKKEADDIGQNLIFKILGRTTLDDIKVKTDKGNTKTILKSGEIINWKVAETIVSSGLEKVRIRSPLSCKTIRGVCQKCYGWDLGLSQQIKLGEAIGIVASQAIGEPGTQLTMRTFHTGGVAGGGDITSGLPRVQEIFEAREPRGRAVISQVEGKVIGIASDRTVRISVREESKTKATKKGKKQEVVEYSMPQRMAILVNVGDIVLPGQQLCEGYADLKELFKYTDIEKTQKYIIREIQKIYVSQGATIHDKHVEVIVKQMFSRVKIKNSGDSSFVPGEILEKARFLEVNNLLKKENKKLAIGQPILLGMSRVALSTDSFLSAASFQETSRILIKAAIEGKEDRLKGLKENVIIGKLIPAGTGFKK
ncbi:MAG: DNA-directed RNA polymerase subunit beta' [Candidatus Daviesbacteria bacterium GW2011_GWB1_41_5]|uniref:DNA-directed RNA polymerase subunit beta' n=1 Tax=Candidatus Daviesbacteria bacterium GW2011_GWB1_41_5 TaxID=1618429 RepID=A0A0G0YPJ4_9BACT|nr:MAG: DNA-directed RNA polymerase subunit beta' [Candidatus Daviesbacteria bacterium GW2011_GWB1_41_5]